MAHRRRKSEIRNSKSETNPKHKEENPKIPNVVPSAGAFRISPLELRICFEFRAWNFELRASGSLLTASRKRSELRASCLFEIRICFGFRAYRVSDAGLDLTSSSTSPVPRHAGQ